MSIFDLFAKSPFKPMQEHMARVRECAAEIPPLLEALCNGDTAAVNRHERRIDQLEGEADKLKNDLRAHLPGRLLLPVDRRDLLEILALQDSIADTAQDIAGMMVERDMPVPESMRAPLLELGRATESASQKYAQIIDELDELVEMGFRGREAERVERMIDELGVLEEGCDKLESLLRKELFRIEDTQSAVTVMLWYELIRWLGDLSDLAEKAGNRIRLLIAR